MCISLDKLFLPQKSFSPSGKQARVCYPAAFQTCSEIPEFQGDCGIRYQTTCFPWVSSWGSRYNQVIKGTAESEPQPALELLGLP